MIIIGILSTAGFILVQGPCPLVNGAPNCSPRPIGGNIPVITAPPVIPR